MDLEKQSKRFCFIPIQGFYKRYIFDLRLIPYKRYIFDLRLIPYKLAHVFGDKVIAVVALEGDIFNCELAYVIEVHTCAAEGLCMVSHSRSVGLGISFIGEGNILQSYTLDGGFGKSVAIASGNLAILAYHISEYERAEARSSLVNEELLS